VNAMLGGGLGLSRGKSIVTETPPTENLEDFGFSQTLMFCSYRLLDLHYSNCLELE